jgi:diguanylate cyclase (GGDEF)-like protein
MHGRLFDELKLTGALPSPTGVGVAILRLTQAEDYSMGEVTRVIQSDPALTGRIIKLANSALQAGAEPATTAAQATMRLGVRSVRNVALGFTLVTGNRTGTCQGFDYAGYWSRSLARAVTAQAIATLTRTAPAADAFTCGLLSDIGTLALASIHPERYSGMLARLREAGGDVSALEREVFELDHGELAAEMLRDWKLPESFAYAVCSLSMRDGIEEAPDEAARRMTAILAAAEHFASAWIAEQATPAHGSAERASTALSALGIEPAALERSRAIVRAEWAEWKSLLHIPTGAEFDAGELSQRAAQARASAPRVEVKSVPPERKGVRVLAVDDDAVSLKLLEHHLARDGHTVSKAANGRQALIMALENPPQMVVTDWMMPEMDGIELCKSLRRSTEGKGIYILILTGREEEDRVVEAFDAGADEYVVKPFNPKVLLARVRAGQRMVELREQVEQDRLDRERKVSEMAVLNRKLEAAAMTDVLTKLPNRRFAMRKLEDEINGARAAGTPLAVIMADIDHFKSVNDQYGHDMGDLVLRETANVLRCNTRKGDIVCRLGGEEFLIICGKATQAQAAMTAERVRSAVEEHVIGFGFDRHVTVSLGVASTECGPTTVDELLKLSDLRVYAAKAAGRNRVCSRDEPASQAKSA